MSAAEQMLRMIAGSEAAPALIEIRLIAASGGTRQRFFQVGELARAADFALEQAAVADVFAGMAPRRPLISQRTGRQFGGGEAVVHAHCLSTDHDTDESLDLIEDFRPLPTMIVASGSLTASGRPKLHCHWALKQAMRRQDFSHAKTRLALALLSDRVIKDAARVMRVPGTLSHKSDPPRRVELVSYDPSAVYTAEQVLADAPEIPSAKGSRSPRTRGETSAGARVADTTIAQKQERIVPRDYLRDLGGLQVDVRGKALCPFHDDKKPSLHAFESAERGWFCFGCGVGGDVYTFAALLRGIKQRDLHGATFDRIWRLVRTFYGLPVDVDAL